MQCASLEVGIPAPLVTWLWRTLNSKAWEGFPGWRILHVSLQFTAGKVCAPCEPATEVGTEPLQPTLALAITASAYRFCVLAAISGLTMSLSWLIRIIPKQKQKANQPKSPFQHISSGQPWHPGHLLLLVATHLSFYLSQYWFHFYCLCWLLALPGCKCWSALQLYSNFYLPPLSFCYFHGCQYHQY